MLIDWAGSVGALTMGIGVEAMEVVTGRTPKISPRVFRRLLLTFEGSVQGQALEMFGADRDERADTLARLLRGTNEDDLNELITALQEAFVRVNTEDELRAARREQDERAERAGRSERHRRSGRSRCDARTRRAQRHRRAKRPTGRR